MNFKKISAILVGVMVLSVLGGCGSKDKTPVAEMESKYSKYVKLGQYEGVEYVPTKTEITDEDIENEKSYLISSNTARHEIKEGIATMGDTVTSTSQVISMVKYSTVVAQMVQVLMLNLVQEA